MKVAGSGLLSTWLVHSCISFSDVSAIVLPSSWRGSRPCLKPRVGCNICASSTKTLHMSAINDEYPLQNDIILRAARGEKVERSPVWLFRQAGRHLPEYRVYKMIKEKNFLELLQDPEDVAEVTMQPIRRYNLDAAILFSDILVVAQALGIEVEMPGGKGITVPNPLRDPEDVSSRIPETIDVRDKLSHVIAAVTRIKQELKGKVPLIGFSAAPWTLMFYMVGGSSKRNTSSGERWLRDHPEAATELMARLTTVVVDYMTAQVEAGADILQVFEAMGAFISEDNFYEYAMPYLKRIATKMKARCPGVPLMVFARGATYANVALQEAGYDVVTMDTQTDRKATREALAEAAAISGGGPAVVQGNFDPRLLTDRNPPLTFPCVQVREEVAKMLAELGPQKLIANLGEGLMGNEDPETVSMLIDTVHSFSERLIKTEEVAMNK
ncbi:unnamed protein product [Discosporangium mesarthrocarpum]